MTEAIISGFFGPLLCVGLFMVVALPIVGIAALVEKHSFKGE